MVKTADAPQSGRRRQSVLLNDRIVIVCNDAIAQPVFNVLETGAKIFFNKMSHSDCDACKYSPTPFYRLSVRNFVALNNNVMR